MATFTVILGPPGAGKGTQAKILASRAGLAHISTDELFRHHVDHQTDLGILAQTYMAREELVPDEITISMLFERLRLEDARQGAIFDGFPRTETQADALQKMLIGYQSRIDLVLQLTVAGEELIKRLSLRDGDSAEAVKTTLLMYEESTAPLIAYYRGQNLLVEINGMPEVDCVAESVWEHYRVMKLFENLELA